MYYLSFEDDTNIKKKIYTLKSLCYRAEDWRSDRDWRIVLVVFILYQIAGYVLVLCSKVSFCYIHTLKIFINTYYSYILDFLPETVGVVTFRVRTTVLQEVRFTLVRYARILMKVHILFF